MKPRLPRNELPPKDSIINSLPGVFCFILVNIGLIGFMAFKSYTAAALGAIGLFFMWLLYW